MSKATIQAIDESADFGCPNVIAFTGYEEEFSLEDGSRNCVEGFKKVVGHAEKKGVTICLEMLNTRDGSDPNEGHPGYQGDHIDYCLDIVKKVASPRLKLLFDIYHVQIMDGDVIRRIGECGEHIGHVHTAGNGKGNWTIIKKSIILRLCVLCWILDTMAMSVKNSFQPETRLKAWPKRLSSAMSNYSSVQARTLADCLMPGSG